MGKGAIDEAIQVGQGSGEKIIKTKMKHRFIIVFLLFF